ncbi:MAG: inositol monophosphatase [Chitinispirillaceae bacterium]|nr:inositol monophosphatase [Chitinispirillaceae bacterium]
MIRELEIAENGAKKAGQIIKMLLGKVRISEKGLNYNLVTEADTAAEKCIIDYIRTVYPEDGILGEETASNTKVEDNRVWIIDPLDGTTNFAHNIPHFSVSIAFAEKGIVRCGVVFNPMYDECFTAVAGGGAWCNGEPIRVSTVSTCSRSVIGTGIYYERGPIMLRTLDSIRKLLSANIQGIRRTGSAALDLCYVACGRFDGYFEYRLSVWDFAAGALIVREAGGTCTDTDGGERGLHSKGVFSNNGLIHEEMFGFAGWPDDDSAPVGPEA